MTIEEARRIARIFDEMDDDPVVSDEQFMLRVAEQAGVSVDEVIEALAMVGDDDDDAL